MQEVLRQAPAIGDSLCDACQRALRRGAAASSTRTASRYELVPTLVRGLDYYTRTTWEFVGPEEGSQSALSGGGRYDGLAEELGGKHTPGVGFGAGIERLLSALPTQETTKPDGIDVFFVCEEGADRPAVAAAMKTLRAGGASAPTWTTRAGR